MYGVAVPDTTKILRFLSPTCKTLEDGRIGRIGVIGGSCVHAGASYFAAISALKLGAAQSYVFCTKAAAPIIQSYSPEFMVLPVLCESYVVRDQEKSSVSEKIIGDVIKWAKHFDCLVIGPGLGIDHFLLCCVSEIMKWAREAKIPMVVEGDGLYLVKNDINLVKGNSLVVLPLYISECKQLAQIVLRMDLDDEGVVQQFLSFTKGLDGVTILLKGKSDYISEGKEVYEVNDIGCARNRCQDAYALCGSIAAFTAWARSSGADGYFNISQTILGCIAASTVFRHAGASAFRNKKRSTLTSDIIENLGPSLEKLCPLQTE